MRDLQIPSLCLLEARRQNNLMTRDESNGVMSDCLGGKVRILELVLAIIGAITFASSWILSMWLWKAMPIQPDSVRGFIIPMIIHGRTIYLNTSFDTMHKSLFWGGLALFAIAVLIDFYKDPFNWRGLRKS